MSRPNLWQSISAWFKDSGSKPQKPIVFESAENVYARALASSRAKRAASVFQPACSIYIRADGTWIFPMNDRDGIGVMVRPATKVDAGAGLSELGAATLTAMDLSRSETSDPAAPWPPSNAAKEAGFKNHGDLDRGAAHLGVRRSADGIIISHGRPPKVEDMSSWPARSEHAPPRHRRLVKRSPSSLNFVRNTRPPSQRRGSELEAQAARQRLRDPIRMISRCRLATRCRGSRSPLLTRGPLRKR